MWCCCREGHGGALAIFEGVVEQQHQDPVQIDRIGGCLAVRLQRVCYLQREAGAIGPCEALSQASEIVKEFGQRDGIVRLRQMQVGAGVDNCHRRVGGQLQGIEQRGSLLGIRGLAQEIRQRDNRAKMSAQIMPEAVTALIRVLVMLDGLFGMSGRRLHWNFLAVVFRIM